MNSSGQSVLGIHGYPGTGHDAGAAVVVDGKLVAAVEEERLARVRHAPGMAPGRAALEVCNIAGIDVRDVDRVAYPWLPEAMSSCRIEIEETIRASLAASWGCPVADIPRVDFIEHHVAHAWAGIAFLPDYARHQPAAVLVVDGMGESTSGAAFRWEDDDLAKIWSLDCTASLGMYYEGMTLGVGFGWGEEGKTMGLASYGREGMARVPSVEDRRLPPDRDMAGPPFGASHRAKCQELREAVRGRLSPDLATATFNERADVALAGQAAVESQLLTYVSELLGNVNSANLILSGGVALNCSINAKVADVCASLGVGFTIPPPASDCGVALGAAVAANGGVSGSVHPYLGRDVGASEAISSLRTAGARVTPASPEAVAARLADSQIGAWFLGASEVGPRALGHRCIIARPDSERVRDRVNALKGREPWRPLAPSVTRREFARSFDGLPSSHMLIASFVRPHAADRLSGVRHVDGSSRPQVVDLPGPYMSLLEATGTTVGSEAVICTSLNLAGRPLVYDVLEALDAAQQMNLDFLAGDGWLVDLQRCA